MDQENLGASSRVKTTRSESLKPSLLNRRALGQVNWDVTVVTGGFSWSDWTFPVKRNKKKRRNLFMSSSDLQTSGYRCEHDGWRSTLAGMRVLGWSRGHADC